MSIKRQRKLNSVFTADMSIESPARDRMLLAWPDAPIYGGKVYFFPNTHEQQYGYPSEDNFDYSQLVLVETEAEKVNDAYITYAEFDAQMEAQYSGEHGGREVIFNSQCSQRLYETRFQNDEVVE